MDRTSALDSAFLQVEDDRSALHIASVAIFAGPAPDQSEILAAIARVETDGLIEANRAELEALELVLHNAIIRSLNNPLIETAYKRMHNYLRLVRLDRKLTPPLALRSLREHMQIILACEARDAEAAMAALKTHFDAALQRHMGLY